MTAVDEIEQEGHGQPTHLDVLTKTSIFFRRANSVVCVVGCVHTCAADMCVTSYACCIFYGAHMFTRRYCDLVQKWLDDTILMDALHSINLHEVHTFVDLHTSAAHRRRENTISA